MTVNIKGYFVTQELIDVIMQSAAAEILDDRAKNPEYYFRIDQVRIRVQLISERLFEELQPTLVPLVITKGD